MFLLCFLSLLIEAQEAHYEYVFFKEGLPVESTGQARISYKNSFDEVPEVEDWIPFTDSIAVADNLVRFSRGPFWLMIPVNNTLDSTFRILVKTISGYSRIMLKSNSNDSAYYFRLEDATYDEYVEDTYFPAARLSIEPGIDTLFLFCEPITKYKASLTRIILDYSDGAIGDREQMIARSERFIFILFAFVSFIAFQIF